MVASHVGDDPSRDALDHLGALRDRHAVYLGDAVPHALVDERPSNRQRVVRVVDLLDEVRRIESRALTWNGGTVDHAEQRSDRHRSEQHPHHRVLLPSVGDQRATGTVKDR
jgi:hypothetical protein